jgi:hypothetical protein
VVCVGDTLSENASVPVALFVHRRHEQLPRTLACLRACGIEQLYVFSDGPGDAADAEGVARVRGLLDDLDWIEPVVVAHTENLGLSRSVRAGLDTLFESHDAAIAIEDDVCVAPEFYSYACAALAHYGDADRVAGITGLRYPFDRRALDEYRYDTFLSPRFSSWAWAIWRDRWREFSFDADDLRWRMAAARHFRPDRAGADMPGMLHAAIVTGTLTGSWDVLCAANMLLRDQYLVTPTWNMVENTGLSDGTHFDRAPAWELRWEPERAPSPERISFAPVETDERVLSAYLRFLAGQGGEHSTLERARLAAARWRTTRRLRRAAR